MAKEHVMIWALKDSGVIRPKKLPDHIERRLRLALSRFAWRIEKIVVFLHDHNGARAGIDKVCRVLVKARGCGIIMAAVTDADWIAAVDRATTRIGRSVARQITRHRDSRVAALRTPARFPEPMQGG
jgi:putative sigma-54 modulation protein